MIATSYALSARASRARATAATAATLASWGHRVLCLDWDPLGLLTSALGADRGAGVAGLVADLVTGAAGRPAELTARYTVAAGGVDLVPASVRPEPDWAALYRGHRLGDRLQDCRAGWARSHDVVLVDAPPGTGGAAAICLAQLAEVVVAHCTRVTAGALGAVLASADAARARLPYGQAQLAVLPAPLDGHLPAEVAGWTANWASHRVPADQLLAALSTRDATAALLARGLAGTRALVADPAGYVAGASGARLRAADELRAEVDASLGRLAERRLDLVSWDAVAEALRALWDSLDHGDTDAVLAAAVRLELVSGETRAGEDRAGPPPPGVVALSRRVRRLVAEDAWT